jgi:hypothetical protein
MYCCFIKLWILLVLKVASFQREDNALRSNDFSFSFFIYLIFPLLSGVLTHPFSSDESFFLRSLFIKRSFWLRIWYETFFISKTKLCLRNWYETLKQMKVSQAFSSHGLSLLELELGLILFLFNFVIYIYNYK